MNICAKCKFHRGKEARTPRALMWYNHLCGHLGVRKVKGVDPVTGKTSYRSRNSLGDVLRDDNPMPYCRSVNPEGKCELFVVCLRGWLDSNTPSDKPFLRKGKP
jgi:hypothetical protein